MRLELMGTPGRRPGVGRPRRGDATPSVRRACAEPEGCRQRKWFDRVGRVPNGESVSTLFVRVCGLRNGIKIDDADRRRLEPMAADRNTPQTHVWHCWILLLTAEGAGANAIMAATRTAKTRFWRGRERFRAEGVDGLLRDKTRSPGQPPVPNDRAAKVVATTPRPPRTRPAADGMQRPRPTASPHGIWTGEENTRAVQWMDGSPDERPRPASPAGFKRSNGELANALAENLHAIVGLYLTPPAHAVVLSLEETSPIQALDSTEPSLPPKKDRGTATHGCKSNGTTTLFAALTVLSVGRSMQRPGIRSSTASSTRSSARSPQEKAVQATLDTGAAHKPEVARDVPVRHPPWTFHVTPPRFWLNAPSHRLLANDCRTRAEGFFATLTRRRTKHGVFHSLHDLQADIDRCVAEHIESPKPFIWFRNPDAIIAARSRGIQALYFSPRGV